MNIHKKRLSALILDYQKFSQNFILCQGLSNGRCPWICNIPLLQALCLGRDRMPVALITYTGVGFCVAVLQRRAMREASDSRTVTDTDSYAFCFIKRQREEDRGFSLIDEDTDYYFREFGCQNESTESIAISIHAKYPYLIK